MSIEPLSYGSLFAKPAAAVTRDDLRALLRSTFGHDAFRPAQEDVCMSVASGRDVLLVMPTGAGKSLCYQLPGLARGGVTLVVSPLLSLIEDQVAKLHELGIAAERIHSGLTREQSREVCRRYLRGELSFLFVAPERLAVPGFPEMLAKRPLSLIAIDEAHCISQWGHDFRPEYRMLGARLPIFRPAPVVALTATATPEVQDDIVRQLGLGAERHVYGFRRDNLVIEAMNLEPSRRSTAIADLLADRDRLAELDQPREIAFRRVIGNARHRNRRACRSAALGQRQIEQPRRLARIVVKKFIEIAHAEEHQRVRILRLGGEVLAHQGCVLGEVGRGHPVGIAKRARSVPCGRGEPNVLSSNRNQIRL